MRLGGKYLPPMVTVSNVEYAPAEPPESAGHLLDLYLPDRRGEVLLPLVIWSGGSGWMRDDGKDGAAAVAERFASRGFAVAGVSVRSSAQATFPAQVHDVKAAIRWLRQHAGEHGLDPDRFAAMGNSSGGWLATMAALTADVGELEGGVGVMGPSSRVQAAVDLYGPTDFLQMDAHMLDGGREFQAFLGIDDNHRHARSPESLLLGAPIETVPEEVERANPVRYVTPAAPPMLVVHGTADPYVPHHQSELLVAALQVQGARVDFYSVEGRGHEHSYLDDPDFEPSWQTIERFVRTALS
jgi:acetyl esterase/lipase